MEAFGGMIALTVVLGIAFVGVIVLALVAMVTGRGEPDPDARRIPALYAATIGFLALFTALFAGFAAVESLLTAAIADEGSSAEFGSDPFADDGFFEFEPEGEPFGQLQSGDGGDDVHYAAAVEAALVALAAAGVFVFHRRLLDGTGFGAPGVRGPAWRVHQAFLYAVCFVAVLTALFTAASALYGLFRVVAPGVTGFGDADVERRDGLVQFLSTGLLAAATVVVYRLHWDRAARDEPSPPGPIGPAAPTPPPPPA